MILEELDVGRYPPLPSNPVKGGSLYLHQKLLVSACMKMEMTQRISGEGLISNFGMIGEMTGAGKTICVISIATLLDQMEGRKRLKEHLLRKNGGTVEHHTPRPEDYEPACYGKTLIIVPTGLAQQWDRELTRFSTVPHVYLDGIKAIRSFDIQKSDVPFILCKSSMFSKFIYYSPLNQNYIFARVFIDECDTISISNFPTPRADFYWFVSATCDSFRSDGMLNCKNYGFVRDTYTRLDRVNLADRPEDMCPGCTRRNRKYKRIYKKLKSEPHPYAHCQLCAHVTGISMMGKNYVNSFYHNACQRTICGGPHNGNRFCPEKVVVKQLVKYRGAIIKGDFNCQETILPEIGIARCHDCKRMTEKQNTMRLIDMLVFRTSPEYVRACLELEGPIEQMVDCATPSYLALANRLEGVVTDEILRAINSGDIYGAAERYGINVATGENILAGIRRDMEKRVAKAEALIEKEGPGLAEVEAEIEGLVPGSDEIKEARQRRTNIQNRIKTQQERIKAFQERLEKISAGVRGEEACSICIDQPEAPTLLSCCRSVFCFGCINTWVVDQKKGSCPYCRARVGPGDMQTICEMESEQEGNSERRLNKEEEVRRLFQVGELGEKVLIFTEQDGTIARLEEVMRELDVPYIAYYKTSAGFTNIKNYLEGPVRAVILNSVSHGAGLNMQQTTDVILYHKMAPNLEQQAIGRAQRPGRTQRLRLWRLAHTGEYGANTEK